MSGLRPGDTDPLAGAAITEVWRYPVKSLAGEPLTNVELDPYGVRGDRQYAIAMANTGQIVTAKRNPALLDAASRWLGEHVEITIPGGRVVHRDAPDTSARLSDWLGGDVRLIRVAGAARSVADYAGDLADPAATTSGRA